MTVCRFPIGGESISVTSGVVSRIEVTSYVHGAAELLGVQIDAAINSGNSGGPAFNNRGQCVGIAFQSLKVCILQSMPQQKRLRWGSLGGGSGWGPCWGGHRGLASICLHLRVHALFLSNLQSGVGYITPGWQAFPEGQECD